MDISADFNSLIMQLQDKSSAKRRASAKKLRKLQIEEAGPFLLSALKKEVLDIRTWETQYQMIMAIGECGYIHALEPLHSLTSTTLDRPMVTLAIGDTITRLEYTKDKTVISIKDWIKAGQRTLSEGGIRAIAQMHLVPERSLINEIIECASKSGNENLAFWTLAACPGWPSDITNDFVNEYLYSKDANTKKAATAALEKRYLKWNPL